ncbi:MAG: DUF3598 family protein [Merismopedia sp. SIO2A8]|nr:DUF3598 family protein [Merismopedia sp. SIO2A8]
MANLWDNLFKNQGVWIGTFTHMAPDGTVVSHTPSRLTLEPTGDASARFQIIRFPEGKEPETREVEFASLTRASLFCKDGSFSKGSMQWSAWSTFGTEFSLTMPDARLRLVQMFEPGNALSYLVLIRETREGKTEVVRPALSIDQLVGRWQGNAIRYFTDWHVSEPMGTEVIVERSPTDTVTQTWRIGDEQGEWTASLTPQPSGPQGSNRQLDDSTGSRILFQDNGLPYQLLFLPNGGSSLCPQTIQPQTAFTCELGWLTTPTTRLRLIRHYNADGSWAYQTWIHEQKVA